jgi:hypothetical protein
MMLLLMTLSMTIISGTVSLTLLIRHTCTKSVSSNKVLTLATSLALPIAGGAELHLLSPLEPRPVLLLKP